MTTGIKNKAELILALLFAGYQESPTSVEGITRLEKLIFLLKEEKGFLKDKPDEDSFTFIPFKMGPWSSEVYDEVDFLESLGLINKDSNEKQSPADVAHNDELFDGMILDKYQKGSLVFSDEKTEVFKLTEKGKKKAKEIWDRLPKEEQEKIIAVKKKFNTMNLKQFLRYVYRKYPEYTTASEIKEYLGIREK